MPGGVELSEFPAALANQFGISLFAGQILASSIVIAFFMFPTIFLQKKYNFSSFASLIMGMMTMSLCVALTWLPVWVFAITAMLIAIMYAGQILKVFGGE